MLSLIAALICMGTILPISIVISPPVETFIEKLLRYYGQGATSEEEFDKASTFVFAVSDQGAVGMIRLTTGCRGPLQKWALDASKVPTGDDVVQLTRAVVAPEFRRRGVFREMIGTALDHCAAAENRLAVTAVECGSTHRCFLEHLGFVAIPGLALYSYTPRKTAFLIDLVYDLSRRNKAMSTLSQT